MTRTSVTISDLPSAIPALWAALLACLLCGACGEPPHEETVSLPTELPIPEVQCVQLVTESVVWPILAEGTVEARVSVTVSARISGQAATVHAEEGDAVSVSQVLVELDPSELALQVAQAEARVQADIANLDLSQRGNRPEEIQGLEARLAQAEAAYEQLLSDQVRNERLHVQGLLSDQLYEDYLSRLDGASASVKQASAAVRLIRKGFRDEERRRTRAQLDASQATLGIAQEQLSYATIRAPLGSRVAKRFIEPGEWVAPGSPLMTLLDITKVRIVVHVAEDDVDRLQLGHPAVITVTAIPGATFSGVIEIIGEQLDPMSRTLPVKVLVDNPQGRLVPGMFAKSEISSAPSADTIVVPRESVHYLESGATVYLMDNDRVRTRPVETGRRDSGWVEVVRGLEPGERVVVSELGALRDGDRATPVMTTPQCPLALPGQAPQPE